MNNTPTPLQKETLKRLHKKTRLLKTTKTYRTRFTTQVNQARNVDAEKDRQCDIDQMWATELTYLQKHRCALSGVTLTNKPRDLCAASIDRKDSTKGHTKDNVQIVTRFVNLGKGALPDQAVKDFFSNYLDSLLTDIETIILDEKAPIPPHLSVRDIKRILKFVKNIKPR